VPRRPFCLYYNFVNAHESRLWPPDAQPGKEPPAEDPGYKTARHAGMPVPAYLPDTPTTRSALLRYYDRLAQQDHFVGRVMNMLRLLDLERDTIVIYMSDHGRGLPREKRLLYEAGIHMPLIVRWPGRVPAGRIGTPRFFISNPKSVSSWPSPFNCSSKRVESKTSLGIRKLLVMKLWYGASRQTDAGCCSRRMPYVQCSSVASSSGALGR